MNTVRQIIRPERLRELSLLLIVIVTIVLFGSQIENYYDARMFNRIAGSVMIIMVVAVGETLVVLTRNIDLSVGSIVGFCAYFVGSQVSNHNDISPLVLVALSVGLGTLLGLINGALVSYGKVPAIIVTLGTLAIYRGLLVEYSGAKTVTTDKLPQWLIDLNRVNLFTIGGIEVRLLVAVAIVVVIVFQLALAFFQYGRRLYAIGSNPEAARVAGMPIRRIVMGAYALCGALSGLAGFMFLARFGNITVTAAQGLELQVVAAAVVGGVNIFGGSGTMFGAMLGAILIGTIEQSLIRLNISEFWKDASLGLFILLAVFTDAVILKRVREAWARSGRKMQLAERAQNTQEGSAHAR